MTKLLARPGFLLLAAVLAVAAGYGVSLLVRQVAAPTPAGPSTILKDLNGVPQQLDAVDAPLRLINFWATWCPPCREEIPLLVQMQNHYRAQGLQIIGVAVDQADAVAEFGALMGINYLSWIADDPFAMMQRYGNADGALPYSVLLARDGTVLARKLGPYTPAELTQILEQALKSAATPAPR